MLRALSYLLIIAGLVIAALGIYSGWTAHHAEQQAEEQWDHMVAARRQPPAQKIPKPVHRAPKGEMLARLSIEKLGGKWIVLEGAERSILRKGPGHLMETALPGSAGNCVIAGHRDTQFRILRDIQVGENISLESDGQTFTYRVIERSIVAPTDNRSLYPTAKPTLTLVTCYPFYYVGHAPKRFVVRAELVPPIQQLTRVNP
jgi:sortase A